jgi:hypothetical protein
VSPFERLASPGMDLAGLVGDGPVVEALDRVDLEVVLRGLLGCGWPVIGSDTAPVPIRRRAGAARGLTRRQLADHWNHLPTDDGR